MDRRVATFLFGGILSVFDELSDPDSDHRGALAASVSDIVEAMRWDGKFASAIDYGLKDPALSQALRPDERLMARGAAPCQISKICALWRRPGRLRRYAWPGWVACNARLRAFGKFHFASF